MSKMIITILFALIATVAVNAADSNELKVCKAFNQDLEKYMQEKKKGAIMADYEGYISAKNAGNYKISYKKIKIAGEEGFEITTSSLGILTNYKNFFLQFDEQYKEDYFLLQKFYLFVRNHTTDIDKFLADTNNKRCNQDAINHNCLLSNVGFLENFATAKKGSNQYGVKLKKDDESILFFVSYLIDGELNEALNYVKSEKLTEEDLSFIENCNKIAPIKKLKNRPVKEKSLLDRMSENL